MTGLNPEKDRILEIFTLVTDFNLNILKEGPNIAIYQKNIYLSNMNKWNLNIHNKTGLINRVKNSFFDEKKAEFVTIKFLKKLVPKGCSPICGNTIAQDRRFLFNYMPDLESYFHYRYIDVSTIKELIIRWNPSILYNFKKKNNHIAFLDVKESIKELIFYRKNFFVF